MACRSITVAQINTEVAKAEVQVETGPGGGGGGVTWH